MKKHTTNTAKTTLRIATPPTFESYKKGKETYVRFRHAGADFDCSIKDAKLILTGIGLFLFLLFLITLALDHD